MICPDLGDLSGSVFNGDHWGVEKGGAGSDKIKQLQTHTKSSTMQKHTEKKIIQKEMSSQISQ